MAKIEDKKLIEQAEELKLNVDDFDSEDDLKDAIDKKLEEELNDVDKLKEKLEYQQEQNKKAYEARDRAKRDTRRLKKQMDEQDKELKTMKEALENSPDADEYNDIKTRLEEIEAEREEKQLAKMDEVDKQKVRFEKQVSELEKKFDESQTRFTKELESTKEELKQKEEEIKTLRVSRLGGEIVREAAKHGAYKPEQIEKLLVSDFVYDDKLQTYTFLERDAKGKIVDELSVSERVKQFLEDPDNDNLVSGTANDGIGSKEQGTDSSKAAEDKKGGKKEQTNLLGGKGALRLSGEYDPKDPDLMAEADEKGLKVEDHIEILKLRDAKMNKVKGIEEDK